MNVLKNTLEIISSNFHILPTHILLTHSQKHLIYYVQNINNAEEGEENQELIMNSSINSQKYELMASRRGRLFY